MSSGEFCGNCRFSQLNPQNDSVVSCVCNPPTPMLIPMTAQTMDKNGALHQQQGLSLQSIFPVVGVKQWCGKWSPKESDVQ
jgi:hypothetical protein